jgi:hypothetical protein
MVQDEAAESLRSLPHVLQVYTSHELSGTPALRDIVGERVMNGVFTKRAPDLVAVAEPYWLDTPGTNSLRYCKTGTEQGYKRANQFITSNLPVKGAALISGCTRA